MSYQPLLFTPSHHPRGSVRPPGETAASKRHQAPAGLDCFVERGEVYDRSLKETEEKFEKLGLVRPGEGAAP
jgi:hypothetical protein